MTLAPCPALSRSASTGFSCSIGSEMTVEQTDPISAEAGDGILLTAAARGDGAAFRHLLDRYGNRVFANCYRVLGERGEAEDATQESFARLWKVLSGQSRAEVPDRDAGGWLMRTSRNLCIDRLRKRRGWNTDDSVLDLQPDPSPSAEAQRQDRDLDQAVQTALTTLPDRQRAAIALVHFDQTPQAEAAETLGISIDALESLLARGRRNLRARLERDRGNLL